MTQAQASIWQKLCEATSGAADGPGHPSIRVLVLAAHPDDETVAAAALLGRTNGGMVAFCTDGAPHDRSLWSPDAQGTREQYAGMRRREAEAALQKVGIGAESISFPGAVDQEAIFAIPELTNYLSHLITTRQPDLVITHAYEGGHPDHDAASLIAHLALGALAPEHRPELAEMPLYHARDGRCTVAEFLPSLQDGAPPPPELILALSAQELACKREMVRCHWSQRLVTAGFPLERERFRVAPVYDYGKPPHAGKLWYECMGWAMTGERWREIAASAIQQARSVCR